MTARHLRIGCHLSSAGGYLGMGRDAVAVGANTFQFFTRNPRGGAAKNLNTNDVAAFLRLARERHIAPLLAHAPYTVNPCAKDPGLREFVRNTMRDDLARMEHTPGNLSTCHPGSHVGQGLEQGIALIADMLNSLLAAGRHTTVLLETMAGKGSEVGSRFEELRAIIDRVELEDRLGVCLDTCHVYDAGYDIVADLDGVLEEFDTILGLDRLRAIHLNDSLNPKGSRKDRHAKIGEGSIGLEAIAHIINHPALRHLPFNLETPNELDGYAKEIALLKSLYNPEST
jgi:deoxyribonuclease-4